MPHVEGKGLVAPKPKLVIIGAETTAKVRRWALSLREKKYGNSINDWRRGVRRDAEFVGAIGQLAVRDWVNDHFKGNVFTMDFELYDGGDGGVDYQAFGVRYEVKTRFPGSSNNLVRRVANGRLLPLYSQVYVFAQLESPVDGDAEKRVLVLGWLETEWMVRTAKQKKSEKGDWFNLVVGDELLRPWASLLLKMENDKRGLAWR